LRFRISGDVAYDDNVNRGISNSRLQDGFASLNASATWPLELSHFTRLLLTGAVGGDHLIQYTGLDRVFVEFNGELQYRGSGQYTSPTYAMFVRESVDWYDSDCDGSPSVGVSVRKPVTDRIFLCRRARVQPPRRGPIFDQGCLRARTFDYRSRRGTLSMRASECDGDGVSTSSHAALASIAEASGPDDVFTGLLPLPRAPVFSISYNVALAQPGAGPSHSVYSKPKDEPPSSLANRYLYVDSQITLSFYSLIRFSRASGPFWVVRRSPPIDRNTKAAGSPPAFRSTSVPRRCG
jgi:hypothetical protein